MKQHLNLLPWKLRRTMLLHVRLRQWGIIWLTLAGFIVCLCARSWHVLSVARHDLEVWKRRASGIQNVSDNNAKLRRQIAALKERREKFGHLNSEHLGFRLLATISQSAAPSGGNHQIQKLLFKQTRVRETTPAQAETPDAPPKPPIAAAKMRDVRTLTLNGIANNNLTIAQFVSSLRDTGAFQKVDLKSSQESKSNFTGPRLYEVECTF